MSIQAAAERLRAEEYSKCGDFEEAFFQESNDTAAVVFEYLRLTDPTPLTPEALKQLGFEVVEKYDDGSGEHLKAGALECVWENCRKGPYIAWLVPMISAELKPRTLGELRQLANRLGIPIKETE